DDINLDRDYDPMKSYRQSKLANVLFSRELAKSLDGNSVLHICAFACLTHTDTLTHSSLTPHTLCTLSHTHHTLTHSHSSHTHHTLTLTFTHSPSHTHPHTLALTPSPSPS